MDARLLRYFIAVVDNRSITAAADALYVSQPAVSRGIKELERECGVVLLDHVGRSVKPSPAGVIFANSARAALRALDACAHTARTIRGIEAGVVSISAPPALQADPLSRMWHEFAEQIPGIELEVVTATDGVSALEFVHQDDAELGLTDQEDTGVLVARPAGGVELVVIAPPDMVPTRGRSVRLDDLQGKPCLASPRGTRPRRMLDAARRGGLDLPLVGEGLHRLALPSFVARGNGWALVPESSLVGLSDEHIRVLSLEPEVVVPISLVHRDAALSLAAKAFIEVCILHDG